MKVLPPSVNHDVSRKGSKVVTKNVGRRTSLSAEMKLPISDGDFPVANPEVDFFVVNLILYSQRRMTQ